MINFLTKFSSFCLLVSVLSCSSTKTDSTTPDAISDGADVTDQRPLMLNGDSDSGTAGELFTVYFDFNSSALTMTGKEILERNADFLKANENVSIQVEGHADERGGIQYNLALSERRAQSVKSYLVALGVSKSKITTIGYGKEKPVDLGHDEISWSKNRRGNFIITAK